MTDCLETEADVARHLALLLQRDPRLGDIAARAGIFTVRRTEPGFAGMARIICGQQLSIASALAIWSRFSAIPGALEPERYLQLTEAEVRASGFSLGKFKTVGAVATAIATGEIDLAAIETLPAEQAIAALTRIKGIGPWTAEIYLMFCAGHPDVFPAGDLALQRAIQWGFGLDDRPSAKALIAMAEAWAPHRATAALLLWRYYAVLKKREGVLA